MKKISAKSCRLWLTGIFVISLLVISTCTMPELTPELYVGGLNIENAGEVNVNKSGEVNIYGEEYLKITQNPDLIYFTTDRNPGLDWYNAGLRVNLIKNDGTDGGDVTSECTFTSVIMTPGVKEITVSKESKTVVFSIAVLEITNSFNELFVSNPPAKTVYRPYESADWARLEVTEVKYGGNPLIPPVTNIYTYPAITVGSLSLTPGQKTITVTKADTAKTASFDVQVYDLTWYVEASGTGAGNTKDTPLPGVQEALSVINQAYKDPNNSWPLDSTGNKRQAAIVVSGKIKKPAIPGSMDMVTVSGLDAYPPILLKGDSPGAVLDANGDRDNLTVNGRVLKITDGNEVTLGDNLTLTGGVAVTDDSERNTWIYNGYRPDPWNYNANQAEPWGFGGGVLALGAAFIMDGGFISNNYAHAGGGVITINSHFTMKGGMITSNKVKESCGGVALYSGSTFIMNNGTIGMNTASREAGVGIEDSYFEMNGGAISANYSSVYDHTGVSAGDGGGGVTVRNGTFTMNGGIINGNTDKYQFIMGAHRFLRAGGVTLVGGTFNLNGGIISNNHADHHGGGVGVMGTFNMTGGIIRNNSSDAKGGGIWVDYNSDRSKINKTGGVIENSNRALAGNSFYTDALLNFTPDENRFRFDMTFTENTNLIFNYINTLGTYWDLIDVPPREYLFGANIPIDP